MTSDSGDVPSVEVEVPYAARPSTDVEGVEYSDAVVTDEVDVALPCRERERDEALPCACA